MTVENRTAIDAFRRKLEEETRAGRRWSRRALSLAAGLGPDAVRDIISGKSKSPSARTIIALCDVLECSPNKYLGSGDANVVDDQIPLIGFAEPSVWREVPFSDSTTAEKIPAVRFIGTSSGEMFAIVARGLSTDEAGIVPGDIVLCEYTDRNELPIYAGEIVVVKRTKSNLHEVTIRGLSVSETADIRLTSRSTQAEEFFTADINLTSAYQGCGEAEEAFEIVGVVRGIYRPLVSPERTRDMSRKKSLTRDTSRT